MAASNLAKRLRHAVLLATALASSAALAGCTRGDAAEARGGGEGAGSMKLPVEVVTLADVPIQDASEFLAQLVSRTQVAIYPQVSGVVTSILVKPGQMVKEGTALLQIDPRRESANLSNQVAAMAQREANLELAKRNASRSAALFHEGLVSRQQLESDQSQAAVAQAEVTAQQAAIGAQSAQLGYYHIQAPFDGAVGDIPVKVGDYVGPQTKLTSVDDNKTLEAYVNVPSEQLGLLTDASRIVLMGYDRSTNTTIAEAPISFVAQEANPQTQSVLVKARFPNGGQLRAAQIVRARVVWKTHPGVRVPTLAVTRQSGQYFAFVATPGAAGTVAHQVPITVGDLDNSTFAVVSGLQAGDQVIVSQLQKLRDGAPITTSPAKAAASAEAGAGDAGH
ncbi:MAG TPA: efflux RND transporter periplasmic adaptor subunit [Polyangiaceae bacterium]